MDELPPAEQVQVWLNRYPVAERLEQLARRERELRADLEKSPLDVETLRAITAWRLLRQLADDKRKL